MSADGHLHPHKASNCCVGVWEPSVSSIRMRVFKGKHVRCLGHTIEDESYIFLEEAISLIETGMMELLYNDTSLTLRQTYALLDCDPFLDFSSILTYLELRRLGFIIIRLPLYCKRNSLTIDIPRCFACWYPSSTTFKKKLSSNPDFFVIVVNIDDPVLEGYEILRLRKALSIGQNCQLRFAVVEQTQIHNLNKIRKPMRRSTTPWTVFYVGTTIALLWQLVLYTLVPQAAPYCYNDTNLMWQPSVFVWKWALAMSSDYSSMYKLPFNEVAYSPINGEDSKPGDVVFVRSQDIHRFIKNDLQSFHHPFTLVTMGSTLDMPTDFMDTTYRQNSIKSLLRNPKLLHWFAHNYAESEITKERMSHVPLGMNFHDMARRDKWFGMESGVGMSIILNPFNWLQVQQTPLEQEYNFNLIPKPHFSERIVGALVDFHFNTAKRDEFRRYAKAGRKLGFDSLRDRPFVEFLPSRIPRAQLWQRKAQYAFDISPVGYGMDCFRTWESLALGNIVIVVTTPLDPLYEGLPVVILDSWDEVTQENMTRWLETFKDMLDDGSYLEKLTTQYWMDIIRSKGLSNYTPPAF